MTTQSNERVYSIRLFAGHDVYIGNITQASVVVAGGHEIDFFAIKSIKSEYHSTISLANGSSIHCERPEGSPSGFVMLQVPGILKPYRIEVGAIFQLHWGISKASP